MLLNFLIPHIKDFCAAAYRYERQNHISERFFSSSVNTMDWSVKKSMQFSDSVCRMNDGKVGQALGSMAVWWIRGVTGGIHEGVGQGLMIMGVEDFAVARRAGKGAQS